MRRTIAVPFVLAALIWPAAAQAGGWATVSYSPRPDGAQVGEPWVVDLTILAHGRTPVTMVEPAMIVRGPNGKTRRFLARPTSRPGVYRARVTWPRAGTYRFEIDDGYAMPSRVPYPPVHVREAGAASAGTSSTASSPPAPAPPDPGFPWTLYLAAVGVLALIAGPLAFALRARDPQARKLPRMPVAGPAAAPDSISRATSPSP